MKAIQNALTEIVEGHDVRRKINPSQNPDIAWFYIFFPALLGYFYMLTAFINAKPTLGHLTINQPEAFAQIAFSDMKFEQLLNLSMGAAGPLWVENSESSASFLLFSDVKQNRIYRWEEGKGFFTVGRTIMFRNSGCQVNESYCESLLEPGSNGILPLLPKYASFPSMDLLVCQQGDRAIGLFRENGTRSLIATHYKNRRLNSPASMIWSPEGHLLFTDPPAGLATVQRKYIGREIPFNGIYMIASDDLLVSIHSGLPTSAVKLLVKDVPRPYDIGFSPDFSRFYVSNAESSNACLFMYDVADSGKLVNGTVFHNFSTAFPEVRGTPRGFKVDLHGNVIATAPGGLAFLSPHGELLAQYDFPMGLTGVEFGYGNRLYVTGKNFVARANNIRAKPNRRILGAK